MQVFGMHTWLSYFGFIHLYMPYSIPLILGTFHYIHSSISLPASTFASRCPAIFPFLHNDWASYLYSFNSCKFFFKKVKFFIFFFESKNHNFMVHICSLFYIIQELWFRVLFIVCQVGYPLYIGLKRNTE